MKPEESKPLTLNQRQQRSNELMKELGSAVYQRDTLIEQVNALNARAQAIKSEVNALNDAAANQDQAESKD